MKWWWIGPIMLYIGVAILMAVAMVDAANDYYEPVRFDDVEITIGHKYHRDLGTGYYKVRTGNGSDFSWYIKQESGAHLAGKTVVADILIVDYKIEIIQIKGTEHEETTPDSAAR